MGMGLEMGTGGGIEMGMGRERGLARDRRSQGGQSCKNKQGNASVKSGDGGKKSPSGTELGCVHDSHSQTWAEIARCREIKGSCKWWCWEKGCREKVSVYPSPLSRCVTSGGCVCSWACSVHSLPGSLSAPPLVQLP